MQGTAAAIEWDDDAFERILQRLRIEGTIDATGVRINSQRLGRILEAARKDSDGPGRSLLKNADFSRATFEGAALFGEATFEGAALFGEATFEGTVLFGEATFKGDAEFGRATFEDAAGFGGATFKGDAEFGRATFKSAAFLHEATFEGAARFGWASFEGPAGFWEATFEGNAGFGWATFESDAVFREATFKGDAVFWGATFESDARFGGATFKGAALFRGVTFANARDFGPVLAHKALHLDQTVFAQPIRIEASAGALSGSRAQFRGGADLLLRRAEVVLDGADFAEPSMLAPRREPVPGEETALRAVDNSDSEMPPKVVSLRRAKVANLTIASSDLRACRFAGAHGLTQLRLERVRFAKTPSGWQRAGRWRVPIWATRRRAIAEDLEWRARQRWWDHWYPVCWLPRTEQLDPEEIAGIYRALRKGREDSKDEPGAADFYYGEMEMRRHAPRGRKVDERAGDVRPDRQEGDVRSAEHDLAHAGPDAVPTSERLILWLYWLVSGYGLRASRALATLGITIAIGALLLDLFGFHHGKGPDDGTLLFAAETSISLLRARDTTDLTAVGHVVQIGLRLAGPLFFGLALLSLRGRVKR